MAINTLRPIQNGRHFADDIFKCIFLNENTWISLNISLKFVPKFRINNIPALVQIMAWRRPGDKPLSEPMMDNLLTHICVTRPQWINFHVSSNRTCRREGLRGRLFRCRGMQPSLCNTSEDLWPLLITWLILIPTWISHYTHYEVWRGIT